jgi:hypothetical protein
MALTPAALIKLAAELEQTSNALRQASQAAGLVDAVDAMAPPSNPSEFEGFIWDAYAKNPDMSLSEALASYRTSYRTRSAYMLHGASIAERGTWVLDNKMIVDLIRDNKKINAIKETRALTSLGLKEAKEAVEWAADRLDQGWVPTWEREQLEAECKEVIDSIMQAGQAGNA